MIAAERERVTHRDTLAALLIAHGVNYDTLTGPNGDARDTEARFASRVLLELAESLWPAVPDEEGIRSWRRFIRETFAL